ncbi:MAG: S41 family peptidase [Bacteroidales bacterium]|nr:S41 family peptidase [Bacteroidales bacterium]
MSSIKNSPYLPIYFAIILIIGIYTGTKIVSVTSSQKNLFSLSADNYNKLNDVVNYIESDYVDSINREKITKEAIDGIFSNLDPHSSYISAEEFVEINSSLTGNFEGIGIQFRIEKDTIKVIHPIEGGPSKKVGIKAGDRIVVIDSVNVGGIGITNSDAMKKLKGKRGTKVNVSIFRRGISELLDFTIIRDVIPTYSLDISYMVNDSIGYVKLNKFSATTYQEFSDALKGLLDQGVKKLILDLRGNVGGYLQAAIQLADEFLKKEELIVYTKGNNRPTSFAYATSKGMFEDKELIVLIDDQSASASEIVAGAIQDNDRALIIGRRSFGKGLVQEQMNLPDGSAVRLTVARYYTPTGRCIQKPYEDGNEDYYYESYERYLNGEMLSVDSVHFNDSLKFTTPKGKVVYGGGGIMPDVFVPISTNPDYKFYNEVVDKGSIFQFVFEYSDKHRQKLEQYKDFEDFNSRFEINKSEFQKFIEYTESKGVKCNKALIDKSKDRILLMLKALIGREIFDNEGFYPIYHKTDSTFLKALNILSGLD